jgi:hypothetical protein
VRCESGLKTKTMLSLNHTFPAFSMEQEQAAVWCHNVLAGG